MSAEEPDREQKIRSEIWVSLSETRLADTEERKEGGRGGEEGGEEGREEGRAESMEGVWREEWWRVGRKERKRRGRRERENGRRDRMRVDRKANEPSTGSEELVLRMLVWGVLS